MRKESFYYREQCIFEGQYTVYIIGKIEYAGICKYLVEFDDGGCEYVDPNDLKKINY